MHHVRWLRGMLVNLVNDAQEDSATLAALESVWQRGRLQRKPSRAAVKREIAQRISRIQRIVDELAARFHDQEMLLRGVLAAPRATLV